MTTIYRLKFYNFEGDNTFELYHNYTNARARFNELWNDYRKFEEFKGDRRSKKHSYLSYFDPNYNAESTTIIFEECALESLFFD